MPRNSFRLDVDTENLYDLVVNWFTYYVAMFAYAVLYALNWYFQLEGALWTTALVIAFPLLTAVLLCLLYMGGSFLWTIICMNMHSPEDA